MNETDFKIVNEPCNTKITVKHGILNFYFNQLINLGDVHAIN